MKGLRLIPLLLAALLPWETRADTLLVVNNLGGTISRVTPDGKVSIFASGLTQPYAIVFYEGNYYVSSLNNTLYKISPVGAVSIQATGFHTGRLTGLASDGHGMLYTSEAGTGIIFTVDSHGAVTNYANGLNNPGALVIDQQGNLFVTQRELRGTNDSVSRIQSNGTPAVFATGFNVPNALVFDQQGNLYVGDSNHTLFKVTKAGAASSFANLPSSARGLAFDSHGDLFATSSTLAGGVIYKITPAGVVTTFATRVADPLGIIAMPPLEIPPAADTAKPSRSLTVALLTPAIILVLAILAWLILRRRKEPN